MHPRSGPVSEGPRLNKARGLYCNRVQATVLQARSPAPGDRSCDTVVSGSVSIPQSFHT